MNLTEKSLGGNIWKQIASDERKAEVIYQKYALPFVVSKIISSRGIGLEEVEDFLDPRLQNLMPDPTILKDMSKATQKIADVVMSEKTVGIIGDYDVDGATSSAILRLYLEDLGKKVEVHIPEREEGYGPSKFAFDKFSALGIDFVVTTDCGTTAFEPFAYAKEKGFEVIVLDHHEAEVKLPEVYALVNPKRLDEENHVEYLKFLAAVGVVFMTLVAINRELRARGFFNNRPEPNLMKFLDLVALGTVCDVVPLVGLNRAFVKQGLKVIAKRENIGLKSLIDKANISEMPTSFHLGYMLGPRINAGGRVGKSFKANELLCSRDEKKAIKLAEELDEFNVQRKEIEAYVLLNAIEQLESVPQEFPMAFVYGHDWHQGVIGIVAGKLKERYNVPSFVMSIEEDEVKGSARSISGVDLGALIISAKEKGVIIKGGGHYMAAGFSLTEEQIPSFQKFVGEYVKAKLGEEEIVPVIEYDGVVDIDGATVEMAEKMQVLEPFGANNPEPKLVIKNVKVSYASVVGSGHIRCSLTSVKGGNLSAMAFRMADTEVGHALLNEKGNVFDVLGTLRKDTWQGRNSVKFFIEDITRG
ncbi:MAG: single-stranded-DNA-specific exonuclease RecJ [Alphaproteobacteria bacterium]|nr:single-stranded-DNA-specific exonuclease RecJ [Alphaproteobacteria bacterium]